MFEDLSKTVTKAVSRRDFVKRAGLLGAYPWRATALGLFGGNILRPSPASAQRNENKPRRLRVAAIITSFTYRSHAHVILENFLEPYLFNGKMVDPGMDVVSFYLDQTPENEMGREVAAKYGIKIYPTIQKALCLGGDKLQVDAVLSIGEHGDYPLNDKGQRLYPRKRFFDEIVTTFRDSNKVVPVYSDKHLSYRWDWAKEMVRTSQEMGFGLMAGSSVPLAQRWPPLELPPQAKIRRAVSIHGGGLESYDFHGLEVLQAMVESRAGGETGVESVQFLNEENLWNAAEQGDWSPELADAAFQAELGPGQPRLKQLLKQWNVSPYGILVRYRDGLKGLVLRAGNSGVRWHFACELEGESEPRATSFYVGPWNNRNLFKALSHAIQTHFRTGLSPYNVERTLLTSVLLDFAMQSRIEGDKEINDHELDIAYQPRNYRAMREMGDSWKILTEDIPEPKGIDPLGQAIPPSS